MSEFTKGIINALDHIDKDGTIDKIIEEALKARIESLVDDIFRWGDVNKLLRDKFEGALIDRISSYDFTDSVGNMDMILSEITNATLSERSRTIMDNFKELTMSPKVKETKLSDIFQTYIKYVANEVDCTGAEVEFYDGPQYESFDACIGVNIKESEYGMLNYCTVTFKVEGWCEDQNEELGRTIQLVKYKSLLNTEWHLLSADAISDPRISSLSSLSCFDVLLINLRSFYTAIELDIPSYQSEDVTPEAEPEATFS